MICVSPCSDQDHVVGRAAPQAGSRPIASNILLLLLLCCFPNPSLGMTVSLQNGGRADPFAAASSTSFDSVATSFLPTLKHAFPTAVSYDILDTIVQANAKGFKLRVQLQPTNEENDDQNNTESSVTVFWKQVRAKRRKGFHHCC